MWAMTCASGTRRTAWVEREAQVVAALNHPHICTLFDVGREGETNYLVMELVEGETLADRVQRGALPAPEVLRLGAQIADALDRAHRAGVIHRDLKPANVMVAKSGVKLMDFGLARAIGSARPGSDGSQETLTRAPLTEEGTIVGTVQYMAPEQLESSACPYGSSTAASARALCASTTSPRMDGSSSCAVPAAMPACPSFDCSSTGGRR